MLVRSYRGMNFCEKILRKKKINLNKFDFSKIIKEEDLFRRLDIYFRNEELKEPVIFYLDSKEVLGYDEPDIYCFELIIIPSWKQNKYFDFAIRLYRICENKSHELIYEYLTMLKPDPEVCDVEPTDPLPKETIKIVAKLIYEDLTLTFNGKKVVMNRFKDEVFKIKRT